MKDGRVEAASGMGRTADLLLINQAMRLNIAPQGKQVKNGKLDMEDLRRQVNEKRPSCYCQRKRLLEMTAPSDQK